MNRLIMKRLVVIFLVSTGLLSCGGEIKLKNGSGNKGDDVFKAETCAASRDNECRRVDDFCYISTRSSDGLVYRSQCMDLPGDCRGCNCLSQYVRSHSETEKECASSAICYFNQTQLVVKCSSGPIF